MKPIVAIIGRPNVGKSTLLNRMAGRKVSVVADTPGVTRDRNYAEAQLSNTKVLLVDTGGFDPSPEDQLEKSVVRQAQMALEEADLVLFICDAKDGLHPFDQSIANLLKKSQKPTLCVVNKCDPGAQLRETWDFHRLGFEFLPVSASHGTGLGELTERVEAGLQSISTEEHARDLSLRLCLLGRPNVGKSSLVNCLAGDERQLVSNSPGTTRDAVDIALDDGDGLILIVDTPGVRRKPKITKTLERLSVIAALRSIERADVAVLVLDGTETFADQDARLMSLVHDRGKGLVVAVNKTDLWSPDQAKKYLDELVHKMRFVSFAPVVKVSALTGDGAAKIISKAKMALHNARTRVTTAKLNKFLTEAGDRLQPPSIKGKRAKLSYMTQASICPPTFIVWVNNPSLVPENYRRFLENQLRKQFAFQGTPLRWFFRRKRQH